MEMEKNRIVRSQLEVHNYLSVDPVFPSCFYYPMEKKTAPTTVSQGKATFWLIVATLFWGGSFVFNKVAFREVPPVHFMFIRFSLATLIMGIFCLRRFPRINRRIIGKGAVVGLALGIANISFVLGVNGTTVSRAGFLNNLFVLIIPFLSFLIWRERVERWNLAGIFLALAGLWQLASGGAEGFNHGDLLSSLCALFIALHIILVSRLLRDEDVYLVTFTQFATVAAIGAVLVLILPPATFSFGPVSTAALIYCAIFPTIICFTIQNTYQRFTTPTRAGLIYTLDPVWSMLGGVVFLGERLSGKEQFGCALIFAAVVLPMAIRLYRERRFGIPYRKASAGGE
jgi:drug/metabolite transporter (DMT)-like permease